MKRLLGAIGTADLIRSAKNAAVGTFDKAVAASVKRSEAPHGEESFGADLDAIVRMWRRRGVADRDIRMELLRKSDSMT